MFSTWDYVSYKKEDFPTVIFHKTLFFSVLAGNWQFKYERKSKKKERNKQGDFFSLRNYCACMFKASFLSNAAFESHSWKQFSLSSLYKTKPQ